MLELFANYTYIEEMEGYGMIHIVKPHFLRVGVIKDWESRWFPEGYDENTKSEEHRQNVNDSNSHKTTAKEKSQNKVSII